MIFFHAEIAESAEPTGRPAAMLCSFSILDALLESHHGVLYLLYVDGLCAFSQAGVLLLVDFILFLSVFRANLLLLHLHS